MVIVVMVIVVAGNHAVSEQAGEIVGAYGVAQKKRPGRLEDFLHGAQIGRVRRNTGLAYGRPFTLG